MLFNSSSFIYLKYEYIYFFTLCKQMRRFYHKIPFLDLYQRTTGQPISKHLLPVLKKRHPNIDSLTHDRLQCTLKVLEKFDISALEACRNPHIFCMNPITMDKYGEILKECGFVNIIPKYIIRYHTIVRSRTIEQLKKDGLIASNLKLEEMLQNYFQDWPSSHKSLNNFPDSRTSILQVRMSVLEKYLNWKLAVTADEFKKFCQNYLPLKHKPMSHIMEALHLAQNVLNFNSDAIRRNGFIILVDPMNTKLIIDNIKLLADVDIHEVIRIEPAILKNNYKSILEIRNILEEYRISKEAQRRYLRVYCMCPTTVKERLEELKNLKEYEIFATNPRILSMVVHKRKLITRLNKIQEARKQCYSLNHLVSSSKVFDNYISSFGNKVCGRDIAILISSSLQTNNLIKNASTLNVTESSQSEPVMVVLKHLKRHKYWLHSSIHIINENIQFLKETFNDDVIFNNCQLLLYPMVELEQYIDMLLKKREGKDITDESNKLQLDANYDNLKYSLLTDGQILSLVLYEIEKKYHFSGDGIWSKQDGVKEDARFS